MLGRFWGLEKGTERHYGRRNWGNGVRPRGPRGEIPITNRGAPLSAATECHRRRPTAFACHMFRVRSAARGRDVGRVTAAWDRDACAHAIWKHLFRRLGPRLTKGHRRHFNPRSVLELDSTTIVGHYNEQEASIHRVVRMSVPYYVDCARIVSKRVIIDVTNSNQQTLAWIAQGPRMRGAGQWEGRGRSRTQGKGTSRNGLIGIGSNA